MKKLICLLFGLLLSIPELFSQEPAKIYLYRSSTNAFLIGMDISIDGISYGKLMSRGRIVIETQNYGQRKLHVGMPLMTEEILLDIRPGTNTYVHLDVGITKLNFKVVETSIGEKEFANSRRFKTEPVNFTDTSIPTETYPDRAELNHRPESTVTQPIPAPTINRPVPAIQPTRRLALVIGNGLYQHGGSLQNPENDAEDIAAVLKKLGFDVMLHTNLDQNGMRRAIDAFGEKLNAYDAGLFYYAGHGVQSRGFNYFIPVDANLRTEAQVEFDCVRTDRLLSVMEDAKNNTNIIILDACRDNPFERSWRRSATGSGLAFMDAPSGSLIAYATAPGRTASDGYGRNGLYTSALLKYLQEPNLTLEEMFKKVRESVSNQSEKAQIPWESTSLTGTFYFLIEDN
jgi:hypothetical protein